MIQTIIAMSKAIRRVAVEVGIGQSVVRTIAISFSNYFAPVAFQVDDLFARGNPGRAVKEKTRALFQQATVEKPRIELGTLG